MKRLVLLLAAVSLAMVTMGCESAPKPLQEFHYIDKEWGQAQMHTWDMHIQHKQSPYVNNTPEGMDGLDAEEVMRVLHKAYTKGPSDAEVFQMGIAE